MEPKVEVGPAFHNDLLPASGLARGPLSKKREHPLMPGSSVSSKTTCDGDSVWMSACRHRPPPPTASRARASRALRTGCTTHPARPRPARSCLGDQCTFDHELGTALHSVFADQSKIRQQGPRRHSKSEQAKCLQPGLHPGSGSEMSTDKSPPANGAGPTIVPEWEEGRTPSAHAWVHASRCC